MGKESYLEVQWTTTLIGKKSMDVKLKNTGYRNGDYEDIRIPKEIMAWLDEHTGGVQHSRIADSQWWWDIVPGQDVVKFYFLDPSLALQFKLTWGGYDVSD